MLSGLGPKSRRLDVLRRLSAVVCGGLVSVCASAAALASSVAVGGYFGNPNGNDAKAEAAFEAQVGAFTSLMGAPPSVMNAFTDFTQSPAAWPGNARWSAWSWSRSPAVGLAVTPVIGIPLSDNAHWQGSAAGSTNDDFFRSVVAGAYDAAYVGVADAWVGAGYTKLYLRLGYEMDGSFMPWYQGDTPAVQADWVAAFQHVSALMRGEAARLGAQALVVWNPADINWTSLSVAASYPGDGYVDVIGCDSYSHLYPASLYNWGVGNNSSSATIAQWWSSTANRWHFWSYPSATQWDVTGARSGWGMEATIAMAHAHGKPLGIAESGAGGDGVSNGPVDDPSFPQWMAHEVSRARSLGVKIAFVSIWDANLSDGDWDFTSPQAAKPLEAAAWKKYWGMRAWVRGNR